MVLRQFINETILTGQIDIIDNHTGTPIKTLFMPHREGKYKALLEQFGSYRIDMISGVCADHLVICVSERS